jgi:hypothetical protein
MLWIETDLVRVLGRRGERGGRGGEEWRDFGGILTCTFSKERGLVVCTLPFTVFMAKWLDLMDAIRSYTIVKW